MYNSFLYNLVVYNFGEGFDPAPIGVTPVRMAVSALDDRSSVGRFSPNPSVMAFKTEKPYATILVSS